MSVDTQFTENADVRHRATKTGHAWCDGFNLIHIEMTDALETADVNELFQDDTLSYPTLFPLFTVIRFCDDDQASNKLEKDLSQRAKIVEEIYTSEKTYVHHLYLTIKSFLYPLQQLINTADQLLTSEEVTTLFSNIEEIYLCNSEFLSDMEQRLPPDNPWAEMDSMGDLFLLKVCE